MSKGYRAVKRVLRDPTNIGGVFNTGLPVSFLVTIGVVSVCLQIVTLESELTPDPTLTLVPNQVVAHRVMRMLPPEQRDIIASKLMAQEQTWLSLPSESVARVNTFVRKLEAFTNEMAWRDKMEELHERDMLQEEPI
ncbi:MAG: hypothetical protein MHM6MM_006625 [Cercozoa sp. M6MM]